MNGFPFQKDRERPFIMKEKKENRGIKSPGFICPVDPETTVSIAKIVKNWKNKHVANGCHLSTMAIKDK